MRTFFKKSLLLGSALMSLVVIGDAGAEMLSGTELVSALRQGGHVLLMRHASSPRKPPGPETANPENKDLERQLDEAGQAGARAMGTAVRALKIPIGDVLSSPTYRALETVRYAALGEAKTMAELSDGGRSMQPDAVEAKSAWLRSKAAERPRAGTNTLIVTHQPNIVGAFGKEWSDLADGETLVIRPNGQKESEVIGRVKIDQWPSLDAR